MKKLFSRSAIQAIGLCALGLVLSIAPPVNPADHGDAPIASNNASTDIADVFAFLDPNDNTRLILAMTQRGFIASGENANFGIFDQFLKYRLQLETTGDAQPDLFIDITFSPVLQSGGPQTATIEFSSGHVFTAPTTRSTTTTESREDTLKRQVVTTDEATGIKFFAGLVDDPFFFDIPGFNRFVASVRLAVSTGTGAPDFTLLERGRDSFAGYNLMGIALSIPLEFLSPPDVIGVSGLILRNTVTRVLSEGGFKTFGEFRQVERMGNPAVNVTLIPFSRKDEHNFATPEDDAAGQFAADIIATLTALGTNETNIGILANVAVVNGDYLRLNLTTPNNSLGVGEFITDEGYVGFPNGRRLGDDTVDVLLYFITNQSPDVFPEDKSKRGDNVNSNDVPLGSTFPFFAPSQQPRDSGVIDDNTRN